MRLLSKIKEEALDILFPKTCLGCGREGEYVCNGCSVFLGESVNDIDKLVSIWEYEGLTEKMFNNIKNKGYSHIINELVERAFVVMIEDKARFGDFLSFLLSKDTYITYVPMYNKKEKQRGFNQAELIARKVRDIAKKEVVPLLVKTKNTLPQLDLGYQERIENTKESFNICKAPWHPKINVVLVDDIYNTGATMQECKKALKEAGFGEVWGLVLARKFSI